MGGLCSSSLTGSGTRFVRCVAADSWLELVCCGRLGAVKNLPLCKIVYNLFLGGQVSVCCRFGSSRDVPFLFFFLSKIWRCDSFVFPGDFSSVPNLFFEVCAKFFAGSGHWSIMLDTLYSCVNYKPRWHPVPLMQQFMNNINHWRLGTAWALDLISALMFYSHMFCVIK